MWNCALMRESLSTTHVGERTGEGDAYFSIIRMTPATPSLRHHGL